MASHSLEFNQLYADESFNELNIQNADKILTAPQCYLLAVLVLKQVFGSSTFGLGASVTSGSG